MNSRSSQQILRVELPTFELSEDEDYSIETVARITRIHRHQIAVYCRHGLVSTLAQPASDGWRFDIEAIRSLRQLEDMRTRFGVNIAGLRIMKDLMSEIDQLRAYALEQRRKEP